MEQKLQSGGRFDRPEDDYAPMLAYAGKRGGISYTDFDSDTIRRVSLFAIRENFDFDGLEETLDRITQVLPSMKRIFASPITRLKEQDEILPAESVRVVNNRTIAHTSVHTELWGDFTRLGLKPKNLLTLTNVDDYAIYENLVFVRCVNMIRQLVERNRRILNEMLYNSRVLEFNLLDRLEHLQYFLAIGKLHVGYVRDFDKSRERAERLLNKMAYIDRVIRGGMIRPVYKRCVRQSGSATALKKTNIFWKHKDYHRIYLLMKYFSARQIDEIREDDASVGQGYAAYCAALSIFAAGHFGYTFPMGGGLNFLDLHASCAFKGWNLEIDRVEDAILFTFQKEKCYKILLAPLTDGDLPKDAAHPYRDRVEADEYLFADPLGPGKDRLYLSLFDLESFRRIQQLLLRGMIRADARLDVCPFCGQELYELDDVNYDNVHGCKFCGTEILPLCCPNTGRTYPAVRIGGRPLSDCEKHFRNITPVGPQGEILCPCCGEDHRNPTSAAPIFADADRADSATVGAAVG